MVKLGKIESKILNELYLSIDGKKDINTLTFMIRGKYHPHPYSSLNSLIKKGLIVHVNKDKKKRYYPNVYKITDKGWIEVKERSKRIDWDKRRAKNMEDLVKLDKKIGILKKKTKNKSIRIKLELLEWEVVNYMRNIRLYNIPYVTKQIKQINNKLNRIIKYD